MKIVSWNVNGFRSLMQQNFLDTFSALNADVCCLQETKLQADEGGVDFPGYLQYWNYAERKGYAGTAILTMREPSAAYCGIGDPTFDSEGRVITLDLGHFYLVNCYAPNAAADLSRLEERMRWDSALLCLLKDLDSDKPVILCGDLNAAYNEADLAGAQQGMHIPGYTKEERSGLTAILQSGFVDAFRQLHPGEKAGAYAYRRGLRAAGLDYFLVSARLMSAVEDCSVLYRVRGSDHWPMSLLLKE